MKQKSKNSGREGHTKTSANAKETSQSIAQQQANQVSQIMTPNDPSQFIDPRESPVRGIPAPQGGEFWGDVSPAHTPERISGPGTTVGSPGTY